ncbi:MAG: glucosaminidase domain-containing protein [Flavobacteriales bacterium]
MNSKLLLNVLLALVLTCLSFAEGYSALQSSVRQTSSQERISRSQYIDTWKETAIQNMIKYKIPASITLAQGILESGDGNSELARKSNNHFGIKCHDWKGKKVYHDDDKKGECFRKYDKASDSFADHSNFLLRKRYASLFELKLTDYKGWAKGLKKCGYATDPAYAKLLISLIEKNELHRFDDENYAIGAETVAENVSNTSKEEKELKSNPKSDSGIPSVISVGNQRVVNFSANKIKFIKAKAGDTPESIAAELDLPKWVIRKYNDLESNAILSEGELVYIQPKRGKAINETHVVKKGETMRSISQRYGIKLRSLYKKNNLATGAQPSEGTRLSLRKKVR